MRYKRHGFTLIEILVVIGIIVLLMGLLVMGYRHLNAAAAGKETVAELKNAKAFQLEYEKQNALKYIEETATVQSPNTTNGVGFSTPVYVDPPLTASGTPGVPTAMPPGYVQLKDLSGTTSDMTDATTKQAARYSSKAVMHTQQVMTFLTRIPATRTLLASLPPKRILEPAPATGGTVQANNISQAVLLDGWNNPIIYVPAGGMVVNIKDPATGNPAPWIVRSTGSQRLTGATIPPLTGSERPFWASAGQDGDFTKGEDNVYSFQE